MSAELDSRMHRILIKLLTILPVSACQLRVQFPAIHYKPSRSPQPKEISPQHDTVQTTGLPLAIVKYIRILTCDKSIVRLTRRWVYLSYTLVAKYMYMYTTQSTSLLAIAQLNPLSIDACAGAI